MGMENQAWIGLSVKSTSHSVAESLPAEIGAWQRHAIWADRRTPNASAASSEYILCCFSRDGTRKQAQWLDPTSIRGLSRIERRILQGSSRIRSGPIWWREQETRDACCLLCFLFQARRCPKRRQSFPSLPEAPPHF